MRIALLYSFVTMELTKNLLSSFKCFVLSHFGNMPVLSCNHIRIDLTAITLEVLFHKDHITS